MRSNWCGRGWSDRLGRCRGRRRRGGFFLLLLGGEFFVEPFSVFPESKLPSDDGEGNDEPEGFHDADD